MSPLETVALMDQYAASVDDGALSSGLAHVGLTTNATASSNTATGAAADKAGDVVANTVTVLEKPVTGLLMLRAVSAAEALSEALLKRCGVSLSSRLQSETKGEYCIRWMSPDAWLLSCPLQEAYAIEKTLREAVSDHIGIVNVSGGYSVLELNGSDARTVLMKSTSYDVHPDHFAEGKVVNTVFAKAQVTLRALQVSDTHSRYELIVRRSFSDYVWMWIQQAAMNYKLTAVRQAD